MRRPPSTSDADFADELGEGPEDAAAAADAAAQMKAALGGAKTLKNPESGSTVEGVVVQRCSSPDPVIPASWGKLRLLAR